MIRGLAQLVARALWEREVSSSSLLTPTIKKQDLTVLFLFAKYPLSNSIKQCIFVLRQFHVTRWLFHHFLLF